MSAGIGIILLRKSDAESSYMTLPNHSQIVQMGDELRSVTG